MNQRTVVDKESQLIKNIDKDIKNQNLVKREDLVDRFGDFGDEIAKYEKYSMNINVKDPGGLAVAESHSTTVNKILKDIEDVRKVYKEPHFRAGKTIDEYAKTLSEPFERAKQRINQAITGYKQVQEAAARAQEEVQRVKAEKIMKEKENELFFLKRITDQAYARLYGGRYVTSSGDNKSSSGCVDGKQCDAFEDFIKEKFPKPSGFTHISEEVGKVFDIIVRLISEHKANLQQLESKNEEIRKEALEKISIAKSKAEIIAEDKLANAEASISKDFRKDIRSIEKETKDAGKGLRLSVLFKVLNEEQVPIDFKEISESLIKSYIQAHKEEILVKLQKNEQPIKGLHIYVEKNYVASR